MNLAILLKTIFSLFLFVILNIFPQFVTTCLLQKLILEDTWFSMVYIKFSIPFHMSGCTFQVILYLINFTTSALKNFVFAVPWTLLWLFLTPCLCCSFYLQYSLSLINSTHPSGPSPISPPPWSPLWYLWAELVILLGVSLARGKHLNFLDFSFTLRLSSLRKSPVYISGSPMFL